MNDSESLRPQYFVMRQNDSMVPLIAMDELPPTFTVRGVPRSLTKQDLRGMECVGNRDSRHRTYIVDNPKSIIAQQATSDKGLQASAFASPQTGYHATRSSSIFPQFPKAYGIEEQYPSSAQSPGPSPALSYGSLRVDRNPGLSSLPPWHDASSLPLKAAPGMKEYCSYWLRHGECDYAQQGCLYKHEMPLDRGVLERLGLRDIPKWYREKHGLGSFLAGNTSIGAVKSNAMERDWREARKADDRERKETLNSAGKTATTPLGKSAKTPSKLTSSKSIFEKSAIGKLQPRRDPAQPSQPPVRSAMQQEVQRKTLEALEADEAREEERKRVLNGKFTVLEPRGEYGRLTPLSSSEEGDGDVDPDNDWIEGTFEDQRAAIARERREGRK